jgi:hypothetical protein
MSRFIFGSSELDRWIILDPIFLHSHCFHTYKDCLGNRLATMAYSHKFSAIFPLTYSYLKIFLVVATIVTQVSESEILSYE